LYFFLTNAKSKQLINNVIVSIDNSIITELDINKEINFVKFINKDQTTNNSELIKKEIINSLIDRKIKDIETNYYKIEVSEKEIENNLYNYLERIKINNETLNSFYNQNEIEKDYLKNIIKIDMKWSKLIRQMYEGRLNVNLTEVNRELEKEQKNTEEDEKLKKLIKTSEKELAATKIQTFFRKRMYDYASSENGIKILNLFLDSEDGTSKDGINAGFKYPAGKSTPSHAAADIVSPLPVMATS